MALIMILMMMVATQNTQFHYKKFDQLQSFSYRVQVQVHR